LKSRTLVGGSAVVVDSRCDSFFALHDVYRLMRPLINVKKGSDEKKGAMEKK
jgi:hypothetical protein